MRAGMVNRLLGQVVAKTHFVPVNYAQVLALQHAKKDRGSF